MDGLVLLRDQQKEETGISLVLHTFRTEKAKPFVDTYTGQGKQRTVVCERADRAQRVVQVVATLVRRPVA